MPRLATNDSKRHCSSPVTLTSSSLALRAARSRCVRCAGQCDSRGLSSPPLVPLVAALRQIEDGESRSYAGVRHKKKRNPRGCAQVPPKEEVLEECAPTREMATRLRLSLNFKQNASVCC